MQLNMSNSDQEQALEIAKIVHHKLQQIIDDQGSATLAVSGGKSPIKIFEHLSNTKLDWGKVNVVLVDERIIQPSHEDSNEHLVKTHLLKNNATKAQFYGLYQDNVSLNNLAKLNYKIDIAILGMGEDGHTASIFPDCPELKQALDLGNTQQYMLTNPLTAKYQRITLTLSAILKIPHLILSISGNIKFNIIKEAYKNHESEYPIGYVLRNRNDTQIYWFE